ncbi:MAG: hypothetical protein H6Q21_1334 [Bacteroidetes bacterium]|jgi:hypothetical protein|nr:hypothetical protein [Bacteroidota bacterium]
MNYQIVDAVTGSGNYLVSAVFDLLYFYMCLNRFYS